MSKPRKPREKKQYSDVFDLLSRGSVRDIRHRTTLNDDRLDLLFSEFLILDYNAKTAFIDRMLRQDRGEEKPVGVF